MMIDSQTNAKRTPFEIGLYDRPISVILGHTFYKLVLRFMSEIEQFELLEVNVRLAEA